MNYSKIIKDVQKKISPQAKKLKTDKFLAAITEEFTKNSIEVDFSKKDVLKEIPPNPGIYFFEADFSDWSYSWNDFIPIFGGMWRNKREILGTSPLFYNGKAKKVLKKYKKDQKIPFYLGIRQNLQDRIKEHIFGTTTKTTSALKLKDRALDLAGITFHVSYVVIDVPEELHFILKIIESALRKKLFPIVGKQ